MLLINSPIIQRPGDGVPATFQKGGTLQMIGVGVVKERPI